MARHCNVSQCRYLDSHLTFYHKCGKCNKFGHGRLECPLIHNDEIMCNELIYLLSNSIPTEEYCSVDGCKFKYSHKTSSHSKTFGNDMSEDDYNKIMKYIDLLDSSCYSYIHQKLLNVIDTLFTEFNKLNVSNEDNVYYEQEFDDFTFVLRKRNNKFCIELFYYKDDEFYDYVLGCSPLANQTVEVVDDDSICII